MSKLKGLHRQLLVLAHEDGLPGREISKIMAMPEGTVKSTLHAARGVIKKCLQRLLREATE